MIVPKNWLGFTLIELLLVIGFISGATATVFKLYPKVQAQYRANTAVQQLMLLNTEVKTLFSTARNYRLLTNEAIYNAKVLPENVPFVDGAMVNIWGGVISVSPEASIQGVDHLNFKIQLTNVPSQECVKVVTAVGGFFLEAYVNGPIGDSGALVAAVAQNPPVEIDPARIALRCGLQANELIFRSN